VSSIVLAAKNLKGPTCHAIFVFDHVIILIATHNHTEPCETRQRPSTVDQTFTINSSEDVFVEESSDSDSQLEDNEPDQVELP